ncbi:MAG: DUF92 domain-containing protein [Thermoplasmatota archaeon]
MSSIMASLLPEYGNLAFILISAILCLLLGIFAYFKRVLDIKASLLAAAIGFLVIGYSDFFWFILLLLFLVVSYFVTIWKYNKKSEKGTSEGMAGERGIKNVIANGAIPFVIVLFSEPLDNLSEGLPGFLFIVAIAIATSDTFASEIGIIAQKPRLITNIGRTVEPGVDGGISMIGNIAAFFGALLIGVFGYLLITDYLTTIGPHGLEANILVIVLATVIGWLGCQLDSVLGATVQTRGWVTNNMVNFITIAIGVLVSIPVFLLLFSL